MVTRHSWSTVKPPTPESNTPTGRESTRRFYEGAQSSGRRSEVRTSPESARGSYKTRVRARLAALGLLATLAAPAAHAADVQPRLVVHGRVAKVPSEIVLRHVGTLASARVLVPAAYGLTLGQPPGTTLGAASADRSADGATQSVSGPVAVAPEGTLACDGLPHTAVWTVQLAAAGAVQATVVVAADAAPAALLVCLAGTGVDRLTLQLAATTLVPPLKAARPVWEALFTAPDGMDRSSVATLVIPAKVTLKGVYQRFKHQISVSGAVLEADGTAPAGRRVVVSIGSKPTTLTTIGATRTHADGSWRGVVTNVRRTLYVRAQAVFPEEDTTATACAPPTLTAPCVSATTAGYSVTSGTAKIVVATART